MAKWFLEAWGTEAKKPDMFQQRVVLWPSGFLEAWGTEAKKHTFTSNEWFVGQAVFWRPGAPRPNHHTCSSNEWFVGQVVFWRPGAPRPKKHTFFRKIWVCWPRRRRRQGQKNHWFHENVWFLGLGTPSLQETTWPKKPLRDSSEPRLNPTSPRGRHLSRITQEVGTNCPRGPPKPLKTTGFEGIRDPPGDPRTPETP